VELQAQYLHQRPVSSEASSLKTIRYTADWLLRRPEEVNQLLLNDLSMTMAALKTHPKIYWIWNHRKWCLENIPAGPGAVGKENTNEWQKSAWEKDLFVVEQMLDVDARNCELLLRLRGLVSRFL